MSDQILSVLTLAIVVTTLAVLITSCGFLEEVDAHGEGEVSAETNTFQTMKAEWQTSENGF